MHTLRNAKWPNYSTVPERLKIILKTRMLWQRLIQRALQSFFFLQKLTKITSARTPNTNMQLEDKSVFLLGCAAVNHSATLQPMTSQASDSLAFICKLFIKVLSHSILCCWWTKREMLLRRRPSSQRPEPLGSSQTFSVRQENCR